MKKQDLKLTKLKELFMDGGILSVYDIQEILNIKKSRASYYLGLLKSDDVIHVSYIKNRITYYALSDNCSDSSLYAKLTNEDIYKYLILINLYKPLTRLQLYEQIFESYEDEYKPLPLTSFYHIVDKMVDDGSLTTYIKKEKGTSGSRLYSQRYLFPTGNNIPIILTIDTAKQTDINFRVASGMLHGKALISLYNKISVATGNTFDYEFDDSLFIQYGRGYHMDKLINQYYTLLLNNNFQTNAISFLYKGKEIHFSVGILVYSQDKDMLYLIGHRSGTKQRAKEIIKCSDIEKITSLDIENNQYGRIEYIKYLQNMFSISAEEKPEKVEIIFENSPDILIRLKRLQKLRVNASLTETPDGIIYKDEISGLSDFTAYLRGFGYKYKVITPESLKQSLKNTLINTLNKYD